jgi:competence ComEA-like helix-hairpin-helix protein
LQSLDDLLNVTAQNPNQGGGNANTAGGRNLPSGGGSRAARMGSGNSGPPVISQELLEQIADDLTVAIRPTRPGLININTARLDVLMCLPGVERPLAQAIINYRKSTGYFDNVAGLLKVDGMTRAIFKQVVPLVTARSETFRIVCEGKSIPRARASASRPSSTSDAATLKPWLPGGLMNRLDSTNANGLFIDIGQAFSGRSATGMFLPCPSSAAKTGA